MVFYALTDSRLIDSKLGEVVEFFGSREEAEKALRDVLTDECRDRPRLRVAELVRGISLGQGRACVNVPWSCPALVRRFPA